MNDISVLMSVYKSERPEFLDLSLKSIWEDQVLKPDKVVLVQDGPIGKPISAIISKWQTIIGDSFILIINNVNVGLTKSLIKGLEHIQTKYVARMDSDDISLPQRFAKQVEFLENHPEIVVVGGDVQEFSEVTDNLGIRKFPRTTNEAKRIIHKMSPLAHPVVMMRKSIFDRGVSYNPEYRTTQDLALWFDVLAAGYEIANINEVLLKFRREDSVYIRRSNLKDSILEFKIHMKGIYKLYGISPYKVCFPIARFIIKFLPLSAIKKLYNCKLREKISTV